jgi:hypothetical protein
MHEKIYAGAGLWYQNHWRDRAITTLAVLLLLVLVLVLLRLVAASNAAVSRRRYRARWRERAKAAMSHQGSDVAWLKMAPKVQYIDMVYLYDSG